MFLLFGIFSFTLLAGTTFKLVRFLSTQPDQEYVIKGTLKKTNWAESYRNSDK